MGLAFPVTEFQVWSWLDGCEDSMRTAAPRTGKPSIASPRLDQLSTAFPRNVTRNASWPPASWTACPRTVAMDISNSPLGDLRTTGPVCAAAGSAASIRAAVAASFEFESISTSALSVANSDSKKAGQEAPPTGPALSGAGLLACLLDDWSYLARLATRSSLTMSATLRVNLISSPEILPLYTMRSAWP